MIGRRDLPAVLTSLAAAALLGLSGCTTRGGTVPYRAAGLAPPDLPKLDVVGRHLTAGDVITVRVFKVDSLSGDQTIDAAGRINLPLIGYVTAAGSTTAELEARLKEQLGQRYLTNPQVAVTLKEAVQRMLTVDGSVLQPGIYPIQPETTLIQAIAMARGTAEDANPRRVVIFRKIDGQRMAAAFDLTSIRRGEAPDPPVFAQDVVVVDGSASTKTFKTVLQSLPLVAIFRPF